MPDAASLGSGPRGLQLAPSGTCGRFRTRGTDSLALLGVAGTRVPLVTQALSSLPPAALHTYPSPWPFTWPLCLVLMGWEPVLIHSETTTVVVTEC